MQMPPLMQPEQQTPPWQTPELHLVPLVDGEETHLPEVHVAVEHSLPLLQIVQAAPAVPQADTLLPVVQVMPIQQPEQHLPFLQVPVPHLVPGSDGLVVHLLLTHRGVRHGSVVVHLEQAAPAVPQAQAPAPVWQAVPSQQPEQHFPL